MTRMVRRDAELRSAGWWLWQSAISQPYSYRRYQRGGGAVWSRESLGEQPSLHPGAAEHQRQSTNPHNVIRPCARANEWGPWLT